MPQTSATIANGASVSSAAVLPVPGLSARCIIVPSGFVGDALNFQVSADGSTYVDLYNVDGTLYNVVAAASVGVSLDPDDFKAFPYLKIKSMNAGVAQNQSADVVFTILIG